jgi:hypothetical protein
MELIARETDLMASQLATLTSSDIRRFERDGYVVVRQASSRADALAMDRTAARLTGITGHSPGPVPGRGNHDDGALPWSQPPRCPIVVVSEPAPKR